MEKEGYCKTGAASGARTSTSTKDLIPILRHSARSELRIHGIIESIRAVACKLFSFPCHAFSVTGMRKERADPLEAFAYRPPPLGHRSSIAQPSIHTSDSTCSSSCFAWRRRPEFVRRTGSTILHDSTNDTMRQPGRLSQLCSPRPPDPLFQVPITYFTPSN